MNEEKRATKIQLVINDYLQKDTNYALMLTAPWGAGKTHFLKNVVLQDLDGYKGVWISLYGINHIDDIKTRILISLYPLVNNKLVKTTASLFKILAKSSDFGGLINFSDAYDQAEQEAKKRFYESIDLKDFVLCFDDLERVNPDIVSTNEVLGYINSLVESENIKVILIANEDKIGEENFQEIKEKVIGITLHFSQDFNDAFESILGQITNATSYFLDDVRKHKHTIESFMNIGGMNYRTLKYFLTYFQPVCNSLREMKQPALEPYKERLLSIVTRFMLMICIEFNKGKISFLQNQGLSGYIIIGPGWQLRLKKGAEKEYKHEIVNAYYQEADSYHFYHSLYEYITGGNVFIEENFYSEIKNQFHVSEEDISPAYRCFMKLSYPYFSEVSDQDYIILLREIRQHLIQGAYMPYEFLKIFDYLTRFGNPLRLNKEKLKNDMIAVLKRYQYKYKYDSKTPMDLRFSEDEDNALYFSALKTVILQIHRAAKVSYEKSIGDEIKKLYFTDLDACRRRIVNNTGVYREKITLSYIVPKKFFSHYLKMDNVGKNKINSLVYTTYELTQGNNEEIDENFLRELTFIIEKHMESKSAANVSGWLISQLLDFVKERLKAIINSRPHFHGSLSE